MASRCQQTSHHSRTLLAFVIIVLLPHSWHPHGFTQSVSFKGGHFRSLGGPSIRERAHVGRFRESNVQFLAPSWAARRKLVDCGKDWWDGHRPRLVLMAQNDWADALSSENITGEMWQSTFSPRQTGKGRSSVHVLKSSGKCKWRMANTVVKQRHPLLRILMLKWPSEWLRGERKLVELGSKIIAEAKGYPEGVEPSRLTEVPHIDIGRRYHISGRAGRGAFASVLAAKDVKTGELVAVKRVGDAAPDDFAARRLLRELHQLRKVRGHSNLVSISNLLVRTRREHDPALGQERLVTDAYLVTDLMVTDLAKMMDHAHPFTDEQVRCLMFQFVRSLRHMHRCGIVHRDVKPPNLLVDSLWHLKMCDLGIARSVVDFDDAAPISSIDRRFTDYVVTRPYRAPELLLGSKNYSTAVDMWAAGCIMAELLASEVEVSRAPLSRNTSAGLLRMPLFPGFDHRDMMQRIILALGHPTPQELAALTAWEPRARAFVEKQPFRACDVETQREITGIDNVPAYCTVNDDGTAQGVDWSIVFPYAPAPALDLLAALLQFDPRKRPSADQCLRHPYFTDAVGPDIVTEQDLDFALRRAAVRSGGREAHKAWDTFWKRCERRLWRKP